MIKELERKNYEERVASYNELEFLEIEQQV